MRRALDRDTGISGIREQGLRFLLSDKGLAMIIAMGTVILVLAAVATLIVPLL
jgi:hypothetical protein